MATSPLTVQTQSETRPAVAGLWWKMLTGVLLFALTPLVLLVIGEAKNFPYPAGARLMVFHVPCAWLSSLAYLVAAWYAVRYLAGTGGQARFLPENEYKSAAAMELGLLFSALTTITGSIFAHLEWGVYWNWDPRETSILVIMLIFAAYVVLRGAVEDPQARGRISSVYALLAIVPGIFLIWVLPRIVPTLHDNANRAVIGNNLGGSYRLIMYLVAFPAFTLLFVWGVQLRVRMYHVIERLERRLRART